MLAIAAAVIFGLALLLDLANVAMPGAISFTTLMLAAFLCLSLHLAGVGTAVRMPSRRFSRR
jgi:hypothetical protein